MRINLKLHELNRKHLEQYLVLRKYSILLYQHSQNSHIMCSFVSSWMLGFPTVLQPTEKSYTVSPLVKRLLFPPHPLWLAVIAKVLLTARLLWMPFSNTLSSSGRALCCQDNTPSPLPSFPTFSQSQKALEEIKNNFLKNVKSLMPELPAYTFTQRWTWIHCQEKNKSTQMGQRQENNNVPKSEIQVEDSFHYDKRNCLWPF